MWLPNKTKRPVKVGSLTRLTAVVVVARVRTAHDILKHRIRRASANITRTARQCCGRPQLPGAGAGNNEWYAVEIFHIRASAGCEWAVTKTGSQGKTLSS